MSVSLSERPITSSALERRTREIGRELFDRIGRGPGVLERAWWDDRVTNLTLNDPAVRVQLFRFIDAMPALRTAEDVRRHLHEYLGEAGDRVPWWLKLAMALTPLKAAARSGNLAWTKWLHRVGLQMTWFVFFSQYLYYVTNGIRELVNVPLFLLTLVILGLRIAAWTKTRVMKYQTVSAAASGI